MVSRNTATAEICAQVFALRFPMRAEQQSLENIQTDQGSWFHINQQKRGWVLDIHPLRQRRGEGHRERAGRCPAFSLNHDFECVDRPAVMPHIQFSWCGECYNGQQWRDELCSIERERERAMRERTVSRIVCFGGTYIEFVVQTRQLRVEVILVKLLSNAAQPRGAQRANRDRRGRGIAALGAVHLAPWMDITKKQHHGGCERRASCILRSNPCLDNSKLH